MIKVCFIGDYIYLCAAKIQNPDYAYKFNH